MFRRYIDFESNIVKTYLEDPNTDPQHFPAIRREETRLKFILEWLEMCKGNFSFNKQPLASWSDTDMTVSCLLLRDLINVLFR